jgi:hypothetical protein
MRRTYGKARAAALPIAHHDISTPSSSSVLETGVPDSALTRPHSAGPSNTAVIGSAQAPSSSFAHAFRSSLPISSQRRDRLAALGGREDEDELDGLVSNGGHSRGVDTPAGFAVKNAAELQMAGESEASIDDFAFALVCRTIALHKRLPVYNTSLPVDLVDLHWRCL